MVILGCVKKHVSPITRIHEGAVNRGSESTKYSIRCRSSLFHLSNCRNRNGEGITNDKQCKPFNRHRAPVTLQDEAASRFDEDNNNSIGFRDAFLKNINAIFQFTRPFFLLGVVSCYLLINLYIIKKQVYKYSQVPISIFFLYI